MKLNDLVLVFWRDAFHNSGQVLLKNVEDDCRWYTVGWVVRMTDKFLSVAMGVQDTDDIDNAGRHDQVVSIPWGMIIDHEVLVDGES